MYKSLLQRRDVRFTPRFASRGSSDAREKERATAYGRHNQRESAPLLTMVSHLKIRLDNFIDEE